MARNNGDMIPVEIDHNTIQKLKQAEENLTEHSKLLLADWELPLTFKSCEDAFGRPDDSGVVQVASGILWIPGPFAQDFWSKARKKPKPTKCQCSCGHKHSPPKGKDATA
jgi:hypothetical protein